ncbi:MAG: sugar phosphate nucleotidyltransferase [Christensenellales bacterium]|nr:sugar phosphate nucleotidyltransferase [Christensenellales bacterium]
MVMKKAALVVMAAGMGSRYGGNKQIDGMGPNGEILMEYSIQDAIRAGFTKVVFIIKPDMLDRMKEICGDRFARQIEVRYAFQDFSSIPGFYRIPEDRVKPFGTVHAVLCARDCVEEPFAVLNADDYYGVEPFAKMKAFLDSLTGADRAAMMGYRMKRTVSRNGTVTRGICQVKDGLLTGVREAKKIQLMPDDRILELTDPLNPETLDPEAPVSMNFWGFHQEIFAKMSQRFEQFLKALKPEEIKAEYLLPVFVDDLLKDGEVKVSVLDTDAVWFGVTYQEDRPAVAEALKKLHEEGVY